MMKKHAYKGTLSLLIAVAFSGLTACGGGGGAPTPTPTPTPPAGTTLQTANYIAGSARAQIFAVINAYRAQCGFPAFQQNTVLDTAAQNHADYMLANGGGITDSENVGAPGFTGATGLDRAVALGWPKALSMVGVVNAGAVWTTDTLSQARYGQSMVDSWSVGVYHQQAIAAVQTLIGIGVAQRLLQGYPQLVGGLQYASATTQPTNVIKPGTVLTFPCQGSTDLPYKALAEVPTPPGTSGAWGTPITVTGNVGDLVTINSGSLVAVGSPLVTTLNVLTASSDPAKLLPQYISVAYPTRPLSPNTTYSVTLTGTVNGAPFSRSFTFTTGNSVA